MNHILQWEVDEAAVAVAITAAITTTEIKIMTEVTETVIITITITITVTTMTAIRTEEVTARSVVQALIEAAATILTCTTTN